jgi:hypothetical protein
MFDFIKGEYRNVVMANGMLTQEWKDYPVWMQMIKAMGLVVLVGIVLALVTHLHTIFGEYSWMGVSAVLMDWVTWLVYGPLAGLCVYILKLKEEER